MKDKALRFKAATKRMRRKIRRETRDVVKCMRDVGCTPAQSKAVRQATMFTLAMAECQRLACRHIDATFPRAKRTKMLELIQSVAYRK